MRVIKAIILILFFILFVFITPSLSSCLLDLFRSRVGENIEKILTTQTLHANEIVAVRPQPDYSYPTLLRIRWSMYIIYKDKTKFHLSINKYLFARYMKYRTKSYLNGTMTMYHHCQPYNISHIDGYLCSDRGAKFPFFLFYRDKYFIIVRGPRGKKGELMDEPIIDILKEIALVIDKAIEEGKLSVFYKRDD